MGLNITNEMNICTFFHGVSAFREFHSFIVLKMFACVCVHVFYVYICLYLTHTKLYARDSIWCVCACICVYAWGRAFERDCCCSIAYIYVLYIYHWRYALSMYAFSEQHFFPNRTHFFPWICYICCSDCIYIIRDFSRDSGHTTTMLLSASPTFFNINQ